MISLAYLSGPNRMIRYEVMCTGSAFVIVRIETDGEGVFAVESTKRQSNKVFLEKLANGLNRDASSPACEVCMKVLRKYEYVV